MTEQELVDALPMPASILRGNRIIVVNARLCALLGTTAEALRALPDPMASVVAPAQLAQIRERFSARSRNEPVPDNYELQLQTASGVVVPGRIRIARYPQGGPDASLYLFEEAGERGRSTRFIRGLVDVAVAAQRERSESGILRAARDGLFAIGLDTCICEAIEGGFRLLLSTEPPGPLAQALKSRGASLVTAGEVPGGPTWSSPQGILLDDVPGLLAALRREPRSSFAAHARLRTVIAGVVVDGQPAYAVTATAEGLDPAVAGAFGLFGRQLGTAIETVRRLDELARKNRELLLVNHVARATATLGSGFALQAALDHVADALGAQSIALFRREDEQLTLAVSRGFPFGWATSNQRVPLKATVPWAEAAASRELIHYALEGDVAIRKPPRQRTPPHGVRRFDPAAQAANEPSPPDAYGVAVPLQIADRVHGLLLIARRHPPFGDDELELLTTISAQLAVNLQNEVLFDQSQRRVSELSLLLELGQAVVSTLDLDKVLAEASRVAVRMLRCSAAYVMLPGQAGDALVCAAGADPSVGGALVGTRVPLSAPSMSAVAFKTLKLQATIDPNKIDPVLIAEFGCLSTLAVPLQRGGKALGVLCLIERSKPRIFEPQDLRLASHAANLISVALENARLYADERARAEEMSRINELSRSLVGALELQPILKEAARTLTSLVDATNCYIFLLDGDKDELRIAAGPATNLEWQRSVRLPADSPLLVAVALREKRPVQLARGTDSPMLSRKLGDRLGDRSVIALPLMARDEPLGVVVLDDTTRDRTFTESEIERLQALCGQIALAMLAARLLEDLRRSYAELARTQAELVERERLAVVGELSASIAHEVRNPLGVIFNSLGSLRRLLEGRDGDVKLLLDIIGEEADRLNRIVNDLLDFARPMQPAVQPVALLPLLRDAVEAARAQHQGAAPLEVEVHVAKPVEVVRADPRLLRQAIVNLVLNALQALGRGGKISLRAELGERGGRPAVSIAVADNGPGVLEPLRTRIFQPFFTTKAKGTGLGLAVVKRIAEGHGGAISLGERAEGLGAEFVLSLPAEEEAAPGGPAG